MSEELIVSNPAVMMGKPVIKGTRITVKLILEKLGTGETIEQILEAPPPFNSRKHPSSVILCNKNPALVDSEV